MTDLGTQPGTADQATEAVGFEPGAEVPETKHRIEFTLQYEFSSRSLRVLLSPLFDGIADSMVDAFVRRAG